MRVSSEQGRDLVIIALTLAIIIVASGILGRVL